MKHNILKNLPEHFKIENIVNPKRIFKLNDFAYQEGDVVYLITREFRVNDNFGLQFAIQKSKELNKNLKIILDTPVFETQLKKDFFIPQLKLLKKNLIDLGFEVLNKKLNEKIPNLLVTDFNPLKILSETTSPVFEVDSHNILPTRIVSDKQEYNAMTFRKKVYNQIFEFMTEFNNFETPKTEADKALSDFIENKLPFYAEFKNNPTKNVTSNMSKYLNLGFISAQRLALEVIKSDVSTENKEAFLEELIVRRELAENFCHYCKNFKTFSCTPQWAQNSLKEHSKDFRNYLYDLIELKIAQTHDELWNAAQFELLKTGKIHGYLRMYWAKKILEWSKTPKDALKNAIYLNDKYAFDAPSPSGYVGILWSIAGLHDRAFANRHIIGKLRPMTYNGAKSKFDIQKYIKKNQI